MAHRLVAAGEQLPPARVRAQLL